MTGSAHTPLRRLLAAFALLALLLGLASCGGGGSSGSSAGNIVGTAGGSSGNGGSDAGGGGAGGADGSGGGDASAGSGGIGGSGDANAGTGGIGGSGGSAGDGSGSTGTADGGSGAGGGIGGTGSPSTAGTVQFYLADAPACGYDAVYVTVQKVRIHMSGSADGDDAGWSEVTPELKRFDLLTLTNGVVADLGSTRLPAGRYTQLRLILADNDAAGPFANSVVPSGESEAALTTPGDIRIDANVDIVAGKTTSLVLDLDACKSVVRRGNSGQYNLKPVISALPLSAGAGLRVTGYVAPAVRDESTQVSLQVGGVPIRATSPEVSGRFVLYPVPPGSYDLVVTSTGHATVVLTGVPVSVAEPTTVSSAGLPIDPPPAPRRMIEGTVTPPSAQVRALQTLSGRGRIEAAWAPVDAATGKFALDLPMTAPLTAAYTGSPSVIALALDSAVAGRYSVEATSGTTLRALSVDAAAASGALTIALP
jgi:hypothetical protein